MKLVCLFLGLCAAAAAQSVSVADVAGAQEAGTVTVVGGPETIRATRMGVFGVQAALDEKVVTGAPYSADAATEVVRTLPDGNRITNTTKSSFYRDSQGRTRREITLNLIGAVADSGTPPRTIIISDPVAKVKYTLEENSHTAHKISTAVASPPMPPPPGASTMAIVKRMDEAKFRSQAPAIAARTIGGDVKTEDLGSRTFSGVAAQGTRTTHTIPAGAIGNERDIEISTETWYSTELQTVVMQKTTSPMDGDTTFQLTNIQRGDPPASMFEVPPDYKLVDDGKAHTFEFFVRKPDAPEE